MNNEQNEFLNRMKRILGVEYADFEQSLKNSSQKSLYVNENKVSIEIFKEIVDFSIEQIPYEKAGFFIDDEKRGRHPLHHTGAFYLQEPSAMFTINAHKFKGNEKVLDMCAAPGGKSIQIANRIPNGVLVSNEIVSARSQILFSNIERMGLKNLIITNEKPENLAKAYEDCFDVCLVDAPCSGEGMFRKAEDVITHWNKNLPEMCAQRQKEILIAADKILKCGGTLIYSTCTYSVEENEDVVRWLQSELGYKLCNIEADLPRGIGMPEAVRLYPHKVKGEGQFVAVLIKKLQNNAINSKNLRLNRDKMAEKFIFNVTGKEKEVYEYNKYSYIIPDLNLIKKNVNYISLGVRVGQNLKSRFEPYHNLFMAYKDDFDLKLNFDHNSQEIQSYIKGDILEVSLKDGYGVMCASNCALGGFKISQGKFKNLYPKGLRNFK